MDPTNCLETVFRRMVDTFASELSTGGWSIFKTEKHIIMEITKMDMVLRTNIDLAVSGMTNQEDEPSESPSEHFDILPVDITPVDITPVDITPVDITPVDITPADVTPVSIMSANAVNIKVESLENVNMNMPAELNGIAEFTSYEALQKAACEAVDHTLDIKPELPPSRKRLHRGDEETTPPPSSATPGAADFPVVPFMVHVNEAANERFKFVPPLDAGSFAEKCELPPIEEMAIPLSPNPATSTHASQTAQCRKCLKTFADIRNLVRHFKTAHLGLRHRCPLCPNSYARSENLRNHINAIHAQPDDDDDDDDDEDDKPQDLKEEMEADENVQDKDKDRDKDASEEGVVATTSPNSGQLRIRPKHAVKREIVVARRLKSKKGDESRIRLECPYCKEVSNGPERLQLHLRDTHRGKIHLCEECYTLFISPWKLKRHQEVHLKPKLPVGFKAEWGDMLTPEMQYGITHI